MSLLSTMYESMNRWVKRVGSGAFNPRVTGISRTRVQGLVGGVFWVKGALQRSSVQTRLGYEAVVLITVRWPPESLRLETFMRPATASRGYGYVRGAQRDRPLLSESVREGG